MNTIKQQLQALADPQYQKFSSALIPNIHSILGVRLPELRKLAKQIVKGDWRSYLAHAENEFFEETMLQGMVIGYAKADMEEILRYTADFVPKIDNWSVCDSFCTGLKIAKTNRERVWSFLQPYISSHREYDIRFGVVMMLQYFIEEQTLPSILQLLDRIRHEGYYVKMAVAWAISECYAKHPKQTMDYLTSNSLDDFTYNKSLQKITESYRVSPEDKIRIRDMKRSRNSGK